MLPLFLCLYTPLLFVASLLLAPAWILKMKKRGGFGTGLIQRLALFRDPIHECFQDTDYYHAVSVGEVVMAIKVIRAIQCDRPDYHAVIAVTTATGHQIAHKQLPKQTLVIYAPLDFPGLIHRTFSAFKPQRLILVDSELWPHLLHYTQRHDIPTLVINGRISEKSFQSFLKLKPILQRLLCHVRLVCVDGPTQVKHWSTLGAPHVQDVGSLKFDVHASSDQPPVDFVSQLSALGGSGPVILIASTHAKEEHALVQEILKVHSPYRLLIAPRHAERRDEVVQDLSAIGVRTCLRSNFTPPHTPEQHALLLDTTGELASWMNLADIVIIGKCWLKSGGQNPFESIASGRLTITGPAMKNFEPLISEVITAGGCISLDSHLELSSTLTELFQSPSNADAIASIGKEFLRSKSGATDKTAQLLLP